MRRGADSVAHAPDRLARARAGRAPGHPAHAQRLTVRTPALTASLSVRADGAPVLTLRLGAGFSYRAYPVSSSLLSRAALRAGMDAMAPR